MEMTLARKTRALLLTLVLFPILSGCDSGHPSKVEVISGPAPGKKIIRLASSDEAIVHILKMTENYSMQRNVQIEVSQTQGKNIPGLIEKNTVDIGVTARRLAPDVLGQSLSYIPYAYDGLVFLAAPDAKVESLSLAQLRQIYQGKIRNWKEVGGADKEIRIIDRPPYSAVRLSMEASIFKGDFPKAETANIMETSENVYQAIRTHPSHIAFAPLSKVMIEHIQSVPLTVEGIAPTISNVPAEKYPATIEYGLVIRRNSPPEVIEFANYMQSVEAMHLLASIAMVPAASKMSLSSCHCRATEGKFDPSKGTLLAGSFTIAVVPELGAIQQQNRYAGIAKMIAEELGVRTVLKHLESYERVIREFEEGRVDAAFVGSLVYGQMHERLGVLPLARPETGTVSYYHGIVIVRSNSGIKDFGGLKGKSFAYVPNTSAGELFCRLLLKRGANAGEQEFFSRVVKVTNHAEAVQMVAEGVVDGAAVKDLVLKRLISEQGKKGTHRLKETIRTIESSTYFPENAFVVSKSLNQKQVAQLREILLSCDSKESGKAALKTLGASRFIPTSHSDYAKMYEMATNAGYSFGKK